MFSKKTAVAAAALLAAFAAQAQVNLYGNLDVSVGRAEEPFGSDGETAVQSGQLRESFIGFRGEEDLGGGLKAFFQLESALNVDTGTQADGNFWGRTSIIGLSGSFGAVTLGNARSLLFLANDAYNPFRADSGLFSTSQQLFGATNFANSVTYSTPNMSGFNAAVQLGLSEIDGVDDTVALGLGYNAGPLGVNFTYEDGAATATDDYKAWLLSASYDFGAAKLFGQVGQADEEGEDDKYKFFQIGASLPVSTAGAVLVSYGQGKQDEFKRKEFSLAYDHSLSKRTGAYIGVNHSKADTGADDDSGTSFAVGVRHSF